MRSSQFGVTLACSQSSAWVELAAARTHQGLVTHDEGHLGVHGSGAEVPPRLECIRPDGGACAVGRHLSAEVVVQRHLRWPATARTFQTCGSTDTAVLPLQGAEAFPAWHCPTRNDSRPQTTADVARGSSPAFAPRHHNSRTFAFQTSSCRWAAMSTALNRIIDKPPCGTVMILTYIRTGGIVLLQSKASPPAASYAGPSRCRRR